MARLRLARTSRFLFAVGCVIAAGCGGPTYDAGPNDPTLPQHPDAVGREITVRPVGAGTSSAFAPVATAPSGPETITPSAIPSVTTAKATYTVGPGQAYTSLSAIASALEPGDVVDVLGDASYSGGVRFEHAGAADKKIVIRGVPRNGKRPIISGGADGIEVAGDHYVFEGLEITGATNRCFFMHADDVTLRDSLVRDCPGHGILGADTDSGSFTMEYVEVRKCGANGPTTAGRQRHQIYMASDERAHPHSTFRMQFSWVHDGNGGNNVKSRAERNEIYYDWIEGGYYHELELIGPDGQDPKLAREDSDVVGNVFVKPNPFYVVRIGGDGTGDTNGRYRFAFNTFVVSSDKAVFRLMDGVESLETSDNAFVRAGGGPVTLFDDSAVKWTKERAVAGTANFLPTGSTAPREWTSTIFGEDPGLANLASNDLRPSSSSPLFGKAVRAAPSPARFAIAGTLEAPAYQPQRAIAPGLARSLALGATKSTSDRGSVGALEAE